MKDEHRAIIEENDPDTIVQQVATEIMEVGRQAGAIKAQYVDLKRSKNERALSRLLQRAPAVDLPDLIAMMAERVVGAFVMACSLAERAQETADDAQEVVLSLVEEDSDDDGSDDVDITEAVKAKVEHQRLVVNYLKSLNNVPDDVVASLADMEADIIAFDLQIAEGDVPDDTPSSTGEPSGDPDDTPSSIIEPSSDTSDTPSSAGDPPNCANDTPNCANDTPGSANDTPGSANDTPGSSIPGEIQGKETGSDAS